MLIPVHVNSFTVDPERNIPLAVLQEETGVRHITIPIGAMEASAIAMNSLNVVPEQVLTIDLVRSLIAGLGGRLERLVIHDYAEDRFLTRLEVRGSDGMHLLPCAVSDALVLAVRSGAGLFVSESVFEKRQPIEPDSPLNKLRACIRNLDTIDFGRYYME